MKHTMKQYEVESYHIDPLHQWIIDIDLKDTLKGKSSENIINTYILLIHTKTHFKNKIALKYALYKEKFSM